MPSLDTLLIAGEVGHPDGVTAGLRPFHPRVKSDGGAASGYPRPPYIISLTTKHCYQSDGYMLLHAIMVSVMSLSIGFTPI